MEMRETEEGFQQGALAHILVLSQKKDFLRAGRDSGILTLQFRSERQQENARCTGVAGTLYDGISTSHVN